jgi:hypothetical protein
MEAITCRRKRGTAWASRSKRADADRHVCEACGGSVEVFESRRTLMPLARASTTSANQSALHSLSPTSLLVIFFPQG